MDRGEALARRLVAQQLGRSTVARPLTDAAVFDLGVQDTGRDGASWALANRGVPVTSPAELERSPAVALAWTLRSAPHYYRRVDLPEVLVATSPMSDRDAAKRIFGPDKPWQEAGIGPVDGLTEVATHLRAVVTEPTSKGEASTRVSARLSEPYLRTCVTCGADHSWEVPFRLGALYAGLELEPGTSPPVLRRIPDWPRTSWGPAPDPFAAPERLQVIRGYLRLLGPATVKDVVTFLRGCYPGRTPRRHRQTSFDCSGPSTCCCRAATATCSSRIGPGTSHSGPPSDDPEQSSSAPTSSAPGGLRRPGVG